MNLYIVNFRWKEEKMKTVIRVLIIIVIFILLFVLLNMLLQPKYAETLEEGSMI